MKKMFAIIGIIGLLGMTVFSIFNSWLFGPRERTPEPKLTEQFSPEELPLADISAGDNQQQTEPDILVNELETEIVAEEIREISPSINLSVPFTSQSPFAKWDNLHNEACEEAALIMAKYWLTNQKLTKEGANEEILASVAWQEDNWGGHYDLSVQSVVELAHQYFNIPKIYFTAVRDIDDIKYELSKENLVITPMAGRDLENPYYSGLGPVYHMLVVTGYNDKDKKIITNDPGTWRGQNFVYSYQNFFSTIHNWPFPLGEKSELSKDEKATEILRGEKMMIVVEKN